VLDTGFNGFFTLSRPVVQALGLLARGSRRATLADGSIVALDVYRATVQWNGQKRRVLVLQAEGGSLVGTSLPYGSRVVLGVVEGGLTCGSGMMRSSVRPLVRVPAQRSVLRGRARRSA
jgi:clan AA aspartic protease